MSKALAVDERRYARLLRQSLPRPIRTEREYEAMKQRLLAVDELDAPSPEQEELAELLAILIQKYEDRHYPLDDLSTPRERLLALMQERASSQSEVSRALGSRSQASGILTGRRSISKTQAMKLADYFRTPVVFCKIEQ
ncbi:MAG: helix-turn-helix domain-containing protein [Acidobacteria bacterium]|nr:helix-turn-helix domain-containing protein [Acidobacteriota bacterium]